MLEALVGSTSAEQVLVFLAGREKGYAKEIADTFNTSPSLIQKQLYRMEREGLLVHHKIGRARVYQWNPRFLFLPELRSLLERVLASYPDDLQQRIRLNRRRPSAAHKPL